jgi:glycosyltransferase involved in cell wall biosynthesis
MVETSIVIPSYRRPALLARALRCCLAQRGVDSPFEIVVVDNDPAGSAETIVAEIAAGASSAPIRYVNEKRPGISHARNTGVVAAAGRYLVFLDDDEEPVPDWLASFVTTIRESGADLAVGPVYPRFTAANTPAMPVFRPARNSRGGPGSATRSSINPAALPATSRLTRPWG